jgi:hypothetical protein
MQDTLYTGSVYALHAQVALFDAEGEDSYPEWETGTEDAVLGPRGIAVATAGDTEIEVVVCSDKKNLSGILCISGEISVGNQGLIVGNVVAANLAQIPWPPGKTSVDVYTNGVGEEVTRVAFVLESK